MRADYWLFALLGIANATALNKRQEDGSYVDYDSGYSNDAGSGYDNSGYDSGYGNNDDSGYDNSGYAAKSQDSYPTKKAYSTKDAYKAYPTKDAYNAYPTKGYSSNDDSYPENSYQSKASPTEYAADQYPTKQGHYDEVDEKKGTKQPWHPKTEHPEFFSLRVDDQCAEGEDAYDCPFDNFAIRLENGIVIATPYNKWWDPKLPIFFVDDDTQLYTVSKQPLQLYIDSVTGALRYSAVGWLPPNSIAFSFYKTGNNPLGKVDPSPASLSWPSTEGNTLYGVGPWSLCSLGNTGQFQVFVNADNYGGGVASGVWKDSAACRNESLAAINANPWKKGQEYPW